MNKPRLNSGKLVEFMELNVFKNTLNHIKTQDPQSMKSLISFETELETSRTRYLNSWHEPISRLQTQLQNLKSEVRKDFAMEIRDAQYYRVNMFDLEAKISEIKENIKNELCSLFKEEFELNKEMQLTERRMEDWGKPLNSKIFKPVINSMYQIESQEVKRDPLGEFQKFLTTSGGHYGGWEEQDHLLFLRERRKFNGKPKFLTAVKSILPDISQDDIEKHENWFKKYETLKNLQKDAIKKWRASKTICEQPEPLQEQKDITENKIKNLRYQRDIAERIKEWKRQHEQKKAEQEEMNRREQERLSEEWQKKRELQKAKKQAVEQYKAEKISKIQNELMVSQKIKQLQTIEEKARKNMLLKAFREQDERYIERIKYLRTQSASKAMERNEKLENVKPASEMVVERDRRRLLQPTQVWNHHCFPQGKQMDKSSKIMDLQTIPHLAVPSWRKGLSHI